MQLEKFVASLSKAEQHDLGLRLVRSGLPVWESYLSESSIVYKDLVVGAHRAVDKSIIANTVIAVEKHLVNRSQSRWPVHTYQLQEHLNQFTGPVAALQDSHRTIPEQVVCVFYAAYNLLKAVVAKDIPDGDTYEARCINLAIHAIVLADVMTPQEIHEILFNYN